MSELATMSSGHWIHWAIVLLMMCGLFIVISRDNLVKKVMGLNIFQVAGILLYVSMGKVRGGTAPIIVEHVEGAAPVIYSNPIPHVLMLTAIVVGIATTALALALAVRIQGAYGTVEEDEIVEIQSRSDRLEDSAHAASAAAGATDAGHV